MSIGPAIDWPTSSPSVPQLSMDITVQHANLINTFLLTLLTPVSGTWDYVCFGYYHGSFKQALDDGRLLQTVACGMLQR